MADTCGTAAPDALSTAPEDIVPRLVAFDLDETLAPSKSVLPGPMAAALRSLLDVVPVCVISGGRFSQFHDQVLAHLGANGDQLSHLHLMPTCGTRYYVHASPDAAAGAAGEAPASSPADAAPASGYEMGTASAGDSRGSGVDPYSGHNFGGSSPDWVDEEPEDNEDAWQLTGR